jgi:hypothetical protein
MMVSVVVLEASSSSKTARPPLGKSDQIRHAVQPAINHGIWENGVY